MRSKKTAVGCPWSRRQLSMMVCMVAFAMPLLMVGSPAAAQGKKKINVKVKFEGQGDKKWGTDAERADMVKKLKEQLQSEWGGDVTIKRGDKEETGKGVDIDVSEGDAGADDVGVVVHDMDDKDGGNFGRYKYADKKVHIYPRNMKDKGWSKDLVLWIEKTAAHEIGHYACADDHNEGKDQPGGPDKMAQSGAVKGYADKNGKTFDDANKDRKFSDDLRVKQLKNLNKAGPQCKTDGDFFDSPGYGSSTLVLDDPAPEEGGIVNFAISASGPLAGEYDLGFANPGPDGLPNTMDDVFLTKWLGDKEMWLDWTPDDGIDDWEYLGPQPLDLVVSLFERSWYAWGIEEIATGDVLLLQDFGTLTLLDPEINADTGRTVYGTALLAFNIDGIGPNDLVYTLSNDLSGLLDADGQPLYPLNKPGTGFTTQSIPAPGAMVLGMIGVCLIGLRRRREARQ